MANASPPYKRPKNICIRCTPSAFMRSGRGIERDPACGQSPDSRGRSSAQRDLCSGAQINDWR